MSRDWNINCMLALNSHSFTDRGLLIWSPVVTCGEAFLRNCVNTIFSRRSSFVGFQLCSEYAPGNKVKISLNIVVHNSTVRENHHLGYIYLDKDIIA